MVSKRMALATCLAGSMVFIFACSGNPRVRARTQAELPATARQAAPKVLSVDAVDTSAWLPPCVTTKDGCLALDSEYIAGVVQCEIGGVTDAGAALEAQAIAARTYLANRLAKRKKKGKVNTTARFQCWRRPRTARVIEAAEATKGVLMLHKGKPINANYVSGTRHLTVDCMPKSPAVSGYAYTTWASMRAEYVRRKSLRKRAAFPGTDWTEVVVTRNEGRAGGRVTGTPMNSPKSSNRGALSQRGAICLAETFGYETGPILRYFYGDDFELSAPLPSPD